MRAVCSPHTTGVSHALSSSVQCGCKPSRSACTALVVKGTQQAAQNGADGCSFWWPQPCFVCRKIIIDAILHTDMTHHFSTVAKVRLSCLGWPADVGQHPADACPVEVPGLHSSFRSTAPADELHFCRGQQSPVTQGAVLALPLHAVLHLPSLASTFDLRAQLHRH